MEFLGPLLVTRWKRNDTWIRLDPRSPFEFIRRKSINSIGFFYRGLIKPSPRVFHPVLLPYFYAWCIVNNVLPSTSVRVALFLSWAMREEQRKETKYRVVVRLWKWLVSTDSISEKSDSFQRTFKGKRVSADVLPWFLVIRRGYTKIFLKWKTPEISRRVRC